MKTLSEILNESRKASVRDLFTIEGDSLTYDGKSYIHYNEMKKGNYYDYVISNPAGRAVEVTCPGLTLKNVTGLNCQWFVAIGAEEAAQGIGVILDKTDKCDWDTDWTYSVRQAVRPEHDGETFWKEKFVNNVDSVYKQLDEFYKNNKIEHFICGYATGKVNPKYHLSEIVKHGNKYVAKPFKVDVLNPELYKKEPSWLVKF